MAAKQDIAVVVGGDTSDLQREMKSGAKAVKKFGVRSSADLKKVAANMAKLGSAAAVAAFVVLGKNALSTADAIGKMADRAGIGTDKLQKMRFAFDLAGVGVEAVDQSLLVFGKRLGKARQGIGALEGGLKGGQEQLLANIKATNSTSEALDVVFKAMGAAKNQAEKLAIADAAFGGAGLKMTAAFNKGSEAFFNAQREAAKLGLVLEEKLIRNAEKLNDDFARASGIIGTQLKRAFLQLAPVINIGVKSLIGFVTELKEVEKINKLLAQNTLENRFGLVSDEIDTLNIKLKKLEGLLGKNAQLLFGDTSGTEQELKTTRDRIKNLEDEKKAIIQAIVANRKFKKSMETSGRTGTGGGSSAVNSKETDALIKKFRAQAATESQKLQELITELNTAVAGGLSQGAADTVLTQRLAEIDKILSKEDEAGLELEARLKRQKSVLESIKNPNAEFLQWIKDVRSQVDEFDLTKLSKQQAEAAIAAESISRGLVNVSPQFGNQGSPDDSGAEFERMQFRLEFLRETVKTEEEIEFESHIRRLEELKVFQENFLITEDDRRALQLDLEQKHQDALVEIRKKGLTDLEKFNAMSFSKQTSTVLGEMVNMTQGVAQSSKAMFEINKTAATAQAIVDGISAVMRTYAAYPFPINIGLAGLQAAANVAQISAIQSQTFQGGGRGPAPSVAGSTAAPAVSDVGGGSGPGKNVFISLSGQEVFGAASIRQLIREINDAVGDGAVLKVN